MKPETAHKYDFIIKKFSEYSGNKLQHVKYHMQYYPYRCSICETKSDPCIEAEQKNLNLKFTMKPFIRIHLKNNHLSTEKYESMSLSEFDGYVEAHINYWTILPIEEILRVFRFQKNTPQKNITNNPLKPEDGPLRTNLVKTQIINKNS